MDYLLTTIAFALGVGYHIMQKIGDLRNKFPEMGKNEVFEVFFEQEWNVLLISCLVLCTNEFALFIIKDNEVKIPAWFDMWGMYAFSLLCGYAGQRLIYKYLGSAEKELTDRIDKQNHGIN